MDDHATETVPTMFQLGRTRHRGTHILVGRNSLGKPDRLLILAEPARCWLQSTVIKTNSQTSLECQEACSPLANSGPEKADGIPVKVSSQQVLGRGQCVRSAGQGKDPDLSQTRLVIRQGVPPLPSYKTMPGPRHTILGPRCNIPGPRRRCAKV